ncbi:MAG: sugar phosphate isomerase/epimerase family protein [Anaerovoracaceae bacterium]|jgi:sugar phosphate isomerase/epimerase
MKRHFLHIATAAEDGWETAARCGLGLELSEFCLPQNLDDADVLPRLRQRLAACPPPSLILHAPYNELYPAAIDPRALQLARGRLHEALDLCDALSCRRLVVHSGFVPMVYFPQWHLQRSVPFWRGLLASRSDDFRLCIENVMETEPEPLAQLMQGIDDPRARLCLDIGHAACSGTRPLADWIHVLAPWIGHVHLHSNDGRRDLHLPLGKGVIDAAAALRRIERECSREVTFTIESIDSAASAAWLTERNFIDVEGTN